MENFKVAIRFFFVKNIHSCMNLHIFNQYQEEIFAVVLSEDVVQSMPDSDGNVVLRMLYPSSNGEKFTSTA